MENMSLYSALVHIHSIGRWILLLLLVFAILNSLIAGNRPYIRTDNRLGLLLTITADIMLLIGIYLYFAGPLGYKLIENKGMSEIMKDSNMRFYGVEHMAGMLIAIILIHVGKTQGRKQISDKAKHRRTMIFYLVALLIILASVPWPFREIGTGRGWY
jgi:L-asparagine transporter-like permease